jgi:hypothetical protein
MVGLRRPRLRANLSSVDYLVPISNEDALRWVLRTQQTAVPKLRERAAADLKPRDRILVYASRGCFRNPTRDRGRVIAEARVLAPPTRLDPPVIFGGRIYSVGFRFRIEYLAKKHHGVELAPLIASLATFPDPASWSARLRSALVRLTPADAKSLSQLLREVAEPYPAALDSYSKS